MKVAVISDIHGNRQAFEAVLDAVAASDASELWCLGDLVGYGADPDTCVQLAREHAAVCLAGNHDLAVVGEIPFDEFSPGARLAAQWTQEVIAPESLAFLAELRPQGQEGPIGLYHASPRDPVWEYVLSALLAELCLDRQPDRVCLIGHSHVALSFVRHEGAARHRRAQARGRAARSLQRRMAAEPRQRRAAARRGPARLLAAARPRRADGLLPACRLRRGRSRRRDSRGASPGLACRAPGVRSMTVNRRNPSAQRSSVRRVRGSDLRLRILLAGLLGVSAALLVACGGSGKGLIPAANAGPLQSDFEAVAQAAQSGEGNCTATEAAIEKTETDFADLPSTVDAGLHKTLSVGISNLRRRALALCAQPLPQTTSTTKTSTPTTTTSTHDDTHDPNPHRNDHHPDHPHGDHPDRHHPGRRHARSRKRKRPRRVQRTGRRHGHRR